MSKTKESAIKHYENMIAWAEKQNHKSGFNWHNDVKKMLEEIGEAAGSNSCPYCQKYYMICGNCELYEEHSILFGCCGGLYYKMTESKSWKEFIKGLKMIKSYIEARG